VKTEFTGKKCKGLCVVNPLVTAGVAAAEERSLWDAPGLSGTGAAGLDWVRLGWTGLSWGEHRLPHTTAVQERDVCAGE